MPRRLFIAFASALACSMVACPATVLAPPDAGLVEQQDGATPPLRYETVVVRGFDVLIHGDPAAVPPDVIALPAPEVSFELDGSLVTAAAQMIDAGLYAFEVPVDMGYYCRGKAPDSGSAYFRWPPLFTKARSLDISQERLGRGTLPQTSRPSTFLVTVDGGALSGPIELDLDSPEGPGSLFVTCSQKTSSSCAGPLWGFPGEIDPTRGDVTFVSEYTDYQPSRSEFLRGRGWTRQADFANPDAAYAVVELRAPDASTTLIVDTASFTEPSLLARIHPSAQPWPRDTNTDTFLAWTLESPWGTGRRYHEPRHGQLELFQATFGVDAGRRVFQLPVVPLPAEYGWSTATEFRAWYTIDLPLGAMSIRFGAALEGRYPTPTPGSTTIERDLLPPENLSIDGLDAMSTSVPQAASLCPTIAWTLASTSALANAFEVTIFEVEPDAGVRGVESLRTIETSLSIPQGVLSAGKFYFLSVRSEILGAPYSEAHPYQYPLSYRSATAVSNIWRTP